MSLEKALEQHPFIGMVCSTFGIVYGFVAKNLFTTHVPSIIIELSQLAAWWVGILVGVVTVWKFIYKTFLKPKENDRSK